MILDIRVTWSPLNRMDGIGYAMTLQCKAKRERKHGSDEEKRCDKICERVMNEKRKGIEKEDESWRENEMKRSD